MKKLILVLVLILSLVCLASCEGLEDVLDELEDMVEDLSGGNNVVQGGEKPNPEEKPNDNENNSNDGANHVHSLEYHPAVEATCLNSGNLEYWECTSGCKNLFADAEGTIYTSLSTIVIPAIGHTYNTEYLYDAEGHWQEATCEHATEVNANPTKINHEFDANGTCGVCSYNTYTAALKLARGGNETAGYYYTIEGLAEGVTVESLVIPEEIDGIPVTKIKSYAFEGATFTSIKLSETLKEIGNGAFWGCKGLTTIDIPKGVEDIGTGIFSLCDNIESITSSGVKGEDTYYVANNCIMRYYPKAMGAPEEYYVIAGCKNSTIPSKTTRIMSDAFYCISTLTTINFPSSITNIGDSAFRGTGLVEAKLGSTKLKNLVRYVFSDCESLTTVTLPYATLKTIQDGAFLNCTSLESIVIPGNVESIYGGAFEGCTALTSVVFDSASTHTWKVDNNVTVNVSNAQTNAENLTDPEKYMNKTWSSTQK